MKALTIRAPWGLLVRDNRKSIELRNWLPKAPPRCLAIHIAAKPDHYSRDTWERDWDYSYQYPRVLGKVVAVVDLTSLTLRGTGKWFDLPRMIAHSRHKKPSEFSRAWGFARCRPLRWPVPATGHQGLWELGRTETLNLLASLARHPYCIDCVLRMSGLSSRRGLLWSCRTGGCPRSKREMTTEEARLAMAADLGIRV